MSEEETEIEDEEIEEEETEIEDEETEIEEEKSNIVEELIEALSDERVINAWATKIADKIIQNLNSIMDNKINEIRAETKVKTQESIDKIVTEEVEEGISACQHQINIQEERINHLEVKSFQNDLIICGLKSQEYELNEMHLNTGQPDDALTTTELVKQQIKKDLNIELDDKDINYSFRMRTRENNKSPPPIMVNFVSVMKRNEILSKARSVRKQQPKSAKQQCGVFYNERLTKTNLEISFLARSMVKNKKLAASWIYRGEIYIKQEASSEPQRIVSLLALKKYE